jgi:hypothetical protein
MIAGGNLGREILGYLVGLQPLLRGRITFIRLIISTPGGELLDAVIHEPPDWLGVASPVACLVDKIDSEGGSIDLVTDIRPSTTLPETTIEYVIIERFETASSGHVVVEGHKQGGGFFSYLLSPPKILLEKRETPVRAVVLRTHQRGTEGIVGVISQTSFQVLKRAKELLKLLKEQEQQRPELEFLGAD